MRRYLNLAGIVRQFRVKLSLWSFKQEKDDLTLAIEDVIESCKKLENALTRKGFEFF